MIAAIKNIKPSTVALEDELFDAILRGSAAFVQSAENGFAVTAEDVSKRVEALVSAAWHYGIVSAEDAARSRTCKTLEESRRAEAEAKAELERRVAELEKAALERAVADGRPLQPVADAIAGARYLRAERVKTFAYALARLPGFLAELDGMAWNRTAVLAELTPASEARVKAALRTLLTDPTAFGLELEADSDKVERLVECYRDGSVSSRGRLRIVALKRFGSLEGEHVSRAALRRLEEEGVDLDHDPETDAKADALRDTLAAKEDA